MIAPDERSFSPDVLDYASPETVKPQPSEPMLRLMSRFWKGVIWSIVAMIAGSLYSPWFGIFGLSALVLCTTATLIFMTIAATRALGWRFAVRHLVLALLFVPFLGLGIFLVPFIVESEIRRSHLDAEDIA